MMTITKIGGVALGLVWMAGCLKYPTFHGSGTLPPQDPILSDGLSQPQTPYQGPGLYCYRTLAEPDCHREPLTRDPNNPNRLIGAYPPSTLPSGGQEHQAAPPLEESVIQVIDLSPVPAAPVIKSPGDGPISLRPKQPPTSSRKK